MAINLTKRQTIDLRKDANDLDQITIGLGWKVREKKKGFLGGILGGKDEVEFDLDAIAFLFDENGKLQDRGAYKLVCVETSCSSTAASTQLARSFTVGTTSLAAKEAMMTSRPS